MIGSKLTKSINNPNVEIYGTMENPIHAKNFELFLSEHYKEIDECLTIAIDADTSFTRLLGTILIANEGISPGSGCGKTLPHIGDFSIQGLTGSHTKDITLLGKTYKYVPNVLDETDIISMADMISDSLAIALNKIFDNEKENLEPHKKLSFEL